MIKLRPPCTCAEKNLGDGYSHWAWCPSVQEEPKLIKFWQKVFIASIRSGSPANIAAEKADDAVEFIVERLK